MTCENFHSKPCTFTSPCRYTHVGSYKLKLPKTFHAGATAHNDPHCSHKLKLPKTFILGLLLSMTITKCVCAYVCVYMCVLGTSDVLPPVPRRRQWCGSVPAGQRAAESVHQALPPPAAGVAGDLPHAALPRGGRHQQCLWLLWATCPVVPHGHWRGECPGNGSGRLTFCRLFILFYCGCQCFCVCCNKSRWSLVTCWLIFVVCVLERQFSTGEAAAICV